MIVHRANAHGIIESFSDCSDAERNRMARRAATDRKEEPQRVADAIAKVRQELLPKRTPQPSLPEPAPSTPSYQLLTARNRRRFTDEQVREIRGLAGTMLQRDIAQRYGVNRAVISQIVRGFTYRDVE